jgi:hypothetical protein
MKQEKKLMKERLFTNEIRKFLKVGKYQQGRLNYWLKNYTVQIMH